MRPSLSLFQMMKAVAYFAVAFACISPMLRLWQMGVVDGGRPEGLVVVAIFGGVAVPLAWAALSFVLIRGPRRDATITALLLGSLSVAQGFACWTLAWFTIPALWSPYERNALSSLVGHLLIVLVLSAAMWFLLLRLWRGYRATHPEPPGLPG